MIEFLRSLFLKNKLERQAKFFEKNPALQERLEVIEDWLEDLDDRIEVIMEHLEIDVKGEK
jgi:hypothetical protein|tara:strand:- start:1053 stop:1235 length:183 start_codon:yes stop_codon:yes gene_type:complete